MATDSDADAQRLVIITTALAAELDRQARTGLKTINVDALAVAVDEAICPPQRLSEGKHPDELNATNDD